MPAMQLLPPCERPVVATRLEFLTREDEASWATEVRAVAAACREVAIRSVAWRLLSLPIANAMMSGH
ncbi:MAG TPA: hypothetical protein VHQ90_04775 [Thermoanaerobaculia bacterium]|nr:hypothetical protein [Thermoanaerobaculia bacterium]